MPRTRRIAWLSTLSAVSLLAASACPAAAAGDDAASALAAALARYSAAVKDGPVDAITACYTEDGELLQPGMAPLRGRQAIHDFLAPLTTQFTVESAAMKSESLEVFGDTAIQWGTYAQVAGPKGGKPGRYEGRFAAEWHRDGDATWRLRRLMVQPTQSAAPAQ